MLILKGIIIGIGKIIPGVSGSMLAISLGVYQRIIDSINNFLRYPNHNISFLLKIAIGVTISIVLFSNIILNSLNKYYIVTMFLFIGLIIGGFEDINKNIKKNNKYLLIISVIIVTILGIVTVDNEIYIQNVFLNILYFVFIGFVDAFTTVVPGISGTATLMMLGAYKSLITSFSNILDFYYLEDNLRILIPFLIGFCIGIVITAKLIHFLLKYYKSQTYSAILGFSIATIVLMLFKSFNSFYTIKDLIIAFILLLLGICITKKINQLFNG